MSAKLTTIEFDGGGQFELTPRFERERVRQKFAELKDSLLAESLEETETIRLRSRLKNAANEAASLAWTTDFPLLVFPELFGELAARERLRELQQERIRARTEALLEQAL